MKHTLSLFFVIIVFNLYACHQSNAQNLFFEDSKLGVNYHYGYLLPEYSFFYYLTNSSIKAYELNFSKQVSGAKLWHKVYHLPDIGISGIYSGLGNDEVFGKSFAIYPSITFNLVKKRPVSLKYQLGLGLTYVTKHFDAESNFKNLPVGSHINIWFNSKLYTLFRITDRYFINSGISFSHLSNANLAEPNIGLNNMTFFIGSTVILLHNNESEMIDIPKFEKRNELSIIMGGSIKKTRRFAPETYFAGSVSFEMKRYLGYKFGLGSGLDLFYDNSIPDEMILKGITDPRLIVQYKTGIHISQELVIGKLSLIVQEGVYIGLTDQLEKKKMYNRGIVRYKFSEHWYANLAMKSNLFVLDVMELGIGYYWN